MKKLVLIKLITLAIAFQLHAADGGIGFINFKKCLEQSKQGQQEKNAFEALKNQMGETLEKSDKELSSLAKKLNDQDYLDGLSEKAEEELKQKFQNLSQEYARYQNQYYQLLNQANYKMLQSLHEKVSLAAEKVRSEKKLSLILSEDSTFAFSPQLDLTQLAVDEMNKQFQLENQTDAIANLK